MGDTLNKKQKGSSTEQRWFAVIMVVSAGFGVLGPLSLFEDPSGRHHQRVNVLLLGP